MLNKQITFFLSVKKYQRAKKQVLIQFQFLFFYYYYCFFYKLAESFNYWIYLTGSISANSELQKPPEGETWLHQSFTFKKTFSSHPSKVKFRQSSGVCLCPRHSCLYVLQTSCWVLPCTAGGGHRVPLRSASLFSALWLAGQLQRGDKVQGSMLSARSLSVL